MNRIDRLVGIVLYLHSKRVIRAEEIATHFRTSVRTVYRDLKALEEAGVPIAGEAGVGYSLASGYHLPPVMFTHEEASALFIGGEFAKQLTDDTLQKDIQSALLKIRSILPSDKKDYLERLQAATEIITRPVTFVDDVRKDVLSTIQHGIARRRVLSMKYYASYKDAVTERDIEPLGLLFYGDQWHVIGYCRLRNDVRDFRADRIQSLTLLSDRFEPNTQFSLKNYMRDRNRLADPHEVQVKFRHPVARFVTNREYYGYVEQSEVSDGTLMTFLVASLPWISSWLFTFGSAAEVISPPELRHIMLESAEKIADKYRK